jgi:hypothetical protein
MLCYAHGVHTLVNILYLMCINADPGGRVV